MSDNHDDQFQDADQASQAPQDARVPRRQLGRRLLKAGVMAVPFVLTLRGRPAQAEGVLATVVTGANNSVKTTSGDSPDILGTGPSSDATWSNSSWTSGDSSGEAADSGSN